MKVVLINGTGCAGKSTFVSFCRDCADGIYECSTVDRVKEAAKLLGWNGVKDDEGRGFLSDLKDLANSYYDLSVKTIDEEIKKIRLNYETLNVYPNVLFVHAREPEELARLKEKYSAITLLIRNPRNPIITTNHADANTENYDYDCIIVNDGSFEDLRNKAKIFLKMFCEVN